MCAMGCSCTKECICDTCLYNDVKECACGVGLCAKCRHVHSWTETKGAKCMYCGADADYTCRCHHTLCRLCRMTTSHVRFFMHHSDGPQTFYVSDAAKVANTDEVKLEWLYMELGVGTT